MARLRYQPATNPRGFQPIQLSSAGITRMQEENQRVIRNLERRREAEISQRERDLQAMEQNQNAEAAQRERNFQIEQRSLEAKKAKSQAEVNFAIQNREDPNKDLEKVITGLADFSQTIGKIAAKRTQQMIADQTELARKDARDAFFSDPSAQTEYKNLESLLPEETAKLDSITTKGMLSGEISTNEASKDFLANPGRNAVYDKAYKNTVLGLLYEADTQNLLQSTAIIPELGFAGIEAIQDENKMRRITQYSLKRSLDKLGLSDKNPGYYQETYEKIISSQDSAIKSASRAQEKANLDKLADQAEFFRGNESTLSASIEADRINPNVSNREVRANFLTTYSAIDPRTGEFLYDIDVLDNVYIPGLDKTVGQAWGGQDGNNPSLAYLQALRDRNQTLRQFRSNENTTRKLNAMDFTRLVALPKLVELTDQEDDSRDPSIFNSFKSQWSKNFPGISYPTALIQAEQVAIAKNVLKEKEYVAERLESTVPIDQEFIDSIQNPALKQQTIAEFKAQQIKRFGPEYPKVLKNLKAKAINVAGFDPTVDGSINVTSTFVLSAMQKKVEEYALEGEKSGVRPELISEYAVNKLNEYVAKAETDKTNLFYNPFNSSG